MPYGLPVWSATRPAARSYVVANGKGVDDGHARLTAAMEAVECACAEASERLVSRWASLGALRADGAKVLELANCARVLTDRVDEERIRGWVRGSLWPDGSDVWAPYELVGMDYRADTDLWDHQSFAMASGGLAAHTDPELARVNALRELIEQEARLFLVQVRGHARSCARFDAREALPETLQPLLDRLDRLGVTVELIDATTDIGVPVVMAILRQPDSDAAAMNLRAAGCACRGSYAEAAAAAVMEAVQSRVTDVAGARDNLSPADFAYRKGSETFPSSFASAPAPLCNGESSETLCSALARVGLGQVTMFDLSPPDVPGIHCWRAVVPEMECLAEPPRRPRRGDRFKARVLAGLMR